MSPWEQGSPQRDRCALRRIEIRAQPCRQHARGSRCRKNCGVAINMFIDLNFIQLDFGALCHIDGEWILFKNIL